MSMQRQADLSVRREEQGGRPAFRRLQDRIANAGNESTKGYQFDGLHVRRSDGQRSLIVHDLTSGYETILRFTPLEYAVLVPLLERFGQPVAAETLYQAAFASPCASRDDRRLYRHIDRIRPKLSHLGIVIRSVARHGYVLLKVPDNSV